MGAGCAAGPRWTVTRLGKTTLYGLGAGVCLALGCYALVGTVYALVEFSGERLISNLRLWLPLAVFFLGFGGWLGYRAFRHALPGVK